MFLFHGVGLRRGQVEVAAVVVFYMVAALVMVFVNKAVLISSPEIPLLFLFAQLVIAVILLHVSALLWSDKVKLPESLVDLEKIKKLAPVVIVNAVGLIFNTLCLRGVEAAFFQIARGLVLPMTIAVQALHSDEAPASQVLWASGIVTAGFILGIVPPSMSTPFSSAEATILPASAIPSSLSLFYGLLSALFIAIHVVLIKSSLPHANNSTLELAYWSNAGSALILAPFVFLTGEHIALNDLVHGTLNGESHWNWSVFLSGTVITGLFGFLLCVAGLLSVKVTSPVTHMFSSAAKSVLQTLFGVWLFNDVMTVYGNRAVSILTITSGTLYYTWIKASGAVKIEKVAEPRLAEARSKWDLEAGSESSEEEDERVQHRKESQ
ncbi:hypothetical protein EXIGLDRAFT_759171 [Exidia glandulosa HHB12029]|uniref:GDP-mannose transporter n=1 Tax=Exidia glandulosa HHB12029 TaxID=1314781 RepID=A0A165Q9Z8_EXIGL|nr:hypothetical protein EXIGLDRAFT_759171 [Exidia glandulosa HHB12029]